MAQFASSRYLLNRIEKCNSDSCIWYIKMDGSGTCQCDNVTIEMGLCMSYRRKKYPDETDEEYTEKMRGQNKP